MDDRALQQQKNEITEYFIYTELAKLAQGKNKKILEKIASEELAHYNIWKSITKQEVAPNKLKQWRYVTLAKHFGLAFSLKMLEKGEENAQNFYRDIAQKYPQVKRIVEDERNHELELIEILNDKKLNHASSIVLGLNDALIELTGTLAGLTFAFANNLIIASTGLIMGIAASLSMAASAYLSAQEEKTRVKDALVAATYTGVAYIITVVFLVAPYFIFQNPWYALLGMLSVTIFIIFLYTKYISVAKSQSFPRKFLTMASLSLGVALISFAIGVLVKTVFGIDV